jgi:hypothetical protein
MFKSAALFSVLLLVSFAFAEKGIGRQDGFRNFDLARDVLEPLASGTYNWEELPIDRTIQILSANAVKSLDFIRKYRTQDDSPEGQVRILCLIMAIKENESGVSGEVVADTKETARANVKGGRGKFTDWLLGAGSKPGAPGMLSSSPQIKIFQTITAGLAKNASPSEIAERVRNEYSGKDVSNFKVVFEELPETQPWLENTGFKEVISALDDAGDSGAGDRMSAPRGSRETEVKESSEGP